MLNRSYNLPYTVPDHVCVEVFGDKAVYFNYKSGTYLKLPLYVHQWIISKNKYYIKDENILEYLYRVLEKLLIKEFITVDLERVYLAEDFIFISHKNNFTVKEKVDIMSIYVDKLGIIYSLLEKKYLTSLTKVNFICCENSGVNYNDMNLYSIILKNYSMLKDIKNLDSHNIIIEADRLPDESELCLLRYEFANRRITIVVDYDQDSHMVYELVCKTTSLKNIEINYNLCFMHNHEPIHQNVVFEDNKNVKHALLKNMKISCGAGKTRFFIAENGDIFPCYLMRGKEKIGNIFSNCVSEIVEQQQYYNYSFNNKCSECKVKFFCAGGCKVNGSNNDLKCNIVKDALYNQLQM